MRKQIFTTTEVANLLKVTPRTVNQWFDSGRIKGYRIPGTQSRRIPRERFKSFCVEHGMPLPEELIEESETP